MRKTHIEPVRRAHAGQINRVARYTTGRKEIGVGLREVEPPVRLVFGVEPGVRAGVSLKHRVVNRRINLIATGSDTRTDRSDQLCRINAGLRKDGECRWCYAGGRSAPAGVNGGHRAAVAIGNKDGDAVGHANGHTALTIEGNDRVGFRRFFEVIARPDDRYGAAVNLPHALDWSRDDGLEPREILLNPIAPELELTCRKCVTRER